MTRLASVASVLARFLTGQCRRRPLTTADVLGSWRRRDKRRSYFAVRHRKEIETDRQRIQSFRSERRGSNA